MQINRDSAFPLLLHPTLLRTTDLQRGGLLLGWAVPSDCPGPSWAPISMWYPLAHGVKEWKMLSLHPSAADLVVRGHQWGSWQEVTTMRWNQKPHCFFQRPEHRGRESADRSMRSELRFLALSAVSWLHKWAANTTRWCFPFLLCPHLSYWFVVTTFCVL